MQQTSFLEEPIAFPKTFEDVESLWQNHICEGETDSDAFTWNEILNGRSYSFYDRLAFRFVFTKKGFPRLQISKALYNTITGAIASEADDVDKFVTVKSFSPEQMAAFCRCMVELKQETFRNLITETFACCNDFNACSDAKHCLHQDDRFYNGCYYRANLEKGLIFFGRNRNA